MTRECKPDMPTSKRFHPLMPSSAECADKRPSFVRLTTHANETFISDLTVQRSSWKR